MPQIIDRSPVRLDQFEQQFLSGAPIGEIGAGQFNAIREGLIRPDEATSPAARRAGHALYATGARPILDRRIAINSRLAQHRANIPDVDTGLTPTQQLAATAGQGRPQTAEQLARKKLIRAEGDARREEALAKIRQRREARRGGAAATTMLPATMLPGLAQQMSDASIQGIAQRQKQKAELAERQQMAMGNQAVIQGYRERGLLGKGLTDDTLNALAESGMTPAQTALFLERMRGDNGTKRRLPSVSELEHLVKFPTQETEDGRIVAVMPDDPNEVVRLYQEAMDVYEEIYGGKQTLTDAHGFEVSIEDLPKPAAPGQQISAMDARKILEAAGGDKDKARQIATTLGWVF